MTKKDSPLKQLLKNIGLTLGLAWKTDKKMFSIIISLDIITALIPIGLSYTFKLLLDEIIYVTDTLGIITSALLGFFAFRYVLEIVFDLIATFRDSYLDRIFRFKTENYLTYKFTEKLSNLDIAHFDDPDKQSLILKARQSYPWRVLNFNDALFSSLIGAVTAIGSFIVLIPFGFWLPGLMVVATIPRFILRKKYTQVEWSIFNQDIPESKELNYIKGQLEDGQSLKEIRVFQAAPALLKKLKKIQEYILKNLRQPIRSYALSSYIPTFIETAVLIFLVYIELGPTLSKIITIGAFTFYMGLLERMSNSIQRTVGGFGRLYDHNFYVGYYFEVLNLPKIIKEKDPGHDLGEIKPPKIEFQNISFSYPKGTRVLNNISLTIAPGEHVAIVGPNGAGKSTLIKLLLRFYDPTKGQIIVNDYDLKDLKLNKWYRFIGILFQDFQKFWLTVKENILLGNPDVIDEHKMIEAAKKSDAHDFIENLPRKYDQRLGKRFEHSIDLSIGQWQKLALARAFYEEAPVLILDEPTSSIDAEAEEQIFNNLYKVYENKSLIIISHRFSTVRNADKIIVLKDGRIVEEGNHESLMKLEGIYARMFRKQAQGYIE